MEGVLLSPPKVLSLRIQRTKPRDLRAILKFTVENYRSSQIQGSKFFPSPLISDPKTVYTNSRDLSRAPAYLTSTFLTMSGFSKLFAGKHSREYPYLAYDLTVRIIEAYEKGLTPASSPAFDPSYDQCYCCIHEHPPPPVTAAPTPAPDPKSESSGKGTVTGCGLMTEDEIIKRIGRVRSPSMEYRACW